MQSDIEALMLPTPELIQTNTRVSILQLSWTARLNFLVGEHTMEDVADLQTLSVS
jgi:hypothetical protein